MPSFTETPSTTVNEGSNTTTAADTSNNQSTQTAQKSEAQLEADRLYEERMEEDGESAAPYLYYREASKASGLLDRD
ncbi:hypothetical protein SBOR_9804 [Sclerotinia borealis F-4128]|uniref:Uncharacterized protein n=1 Tax=Sclerotinia borealis (strain F-4128) TaxID=1432307 RepID=W9C2A1_SCLBF|nr:hypothetical protein SBOR_9804 [Sclerotinia borealis F-4128]